MRARDGTTLVELMVALAMLGVGLLALAAGVAALSRHATLAALDGRAAGVARDLVERDAAAGCGTPVSRDSAIGPLRARWSASDDSATRRVRVEVADTLGRRRAHRFATRAPCAGG